MILTIFRHGEAGRAPRDRDRELTATGREDVKRARIALQQACTERGLPAPGIICYSPWVRTTQTARILIDGLGNVEMTPEPAIQPGASVADATAALEELTPGQEHAVFVSHQPLVSMLANYLLGPGHPAPSLSPGAWVTLSIDVIGGDCGRLDFWSLPPTYAVTQ